MAILNHQKQDGHDYYNGQWGQSSSQKSLTSRDIYFWLVVHGVLRSEIDDWFTKFLPGLYK